MTTALKEEMIPLNEALKIVEARRMKVLLNKSDPSWTEHFAELQNELRNLAMKNHVRAVAIEDEIRTMEIEDIKFTETPTDVVEKAIEEYNKKEHHWKSDYHVIYCENCGKGWNRNPEETALRKELENSECKGR